MGHPVYACTARAQDTESAIQLLLYCVNSIFRSNALPDRRAACALIVIARPRGLNRRRSAIGTRLGLSEVVVVVRRVRSRCLTTAAGVLLFQEVQLVYVDCSYVDRRVLLLVFQVSADKRVDVTVRIGCLQRDGVGSAGVALARFSGRRLLRRKRRFFRGHRRPWSVLRGIVSTVRRFIRVGGFSSVRLLVWWVFIFVAIIIIRLLRVGRVFVAVVVRLRARLVVTDRIFVRALAEIWIRSFGVLRTLRTNCRFLGLGSKSS